MVPSEDLLYGNGTTTGWDSLVLDTPIFNETEYTVRFNVYIDSGYGSEQFHICFDYDLWYYRLELGSEYWASHYLFNESTTGLNYMVPLNKWVQINVISSGEELHVWVDGFQIDPGIYFPAHPLKKFSFGVFDGSHVGFDDLTIFKGKESPDTIGLSIIFDDNYNRPDDSPLDKYTRNADGWRIDGNRLIGDNPGYNWSTCTTDVVFSLKDVTIEFDYDIINYNANFSALSFELTSDPNGRRFIDFYETGDVWYSNQIGEPEHWLSPVLSPLPLSGHISIVIDANTWIKIYHHNDFLGEFGIPSRDSGNIGFGVYNAKIAFDNLFVRWGQHHPGSQTDPPKYPSNYTKYWGISVGDKFEYQLSKYTGTKTEFDVGVWLMAHTAYSTTMETTMQPFSLVIQEGDELTVAVSALLEYEVEVEVRVNEEPSMKAITSFFFIPIHDLGRSKMFNQDFEDYGDYYRITMYENTSGLGSGLGSNLSEVVILWEKATGALKKVELMFGEYSVDPLRENVLTSLLFELTGSKIAENESSIPPTLELTPGFEWLISIGIISLLPLGKKHYKK